MARRKSDNQKERDKKGKDRMEKFEEGNQVKETPIINTVSSDDEYEEYTVTAYQKIEPGEWGRVELTYKRKKRL